MSLVDKLLIKFLTEQISDEDAEAPVGSELGRIAFAPLRPNKPLETNTKIEDKLLASIDDFIHQNITIPAEQCRLIQKFLANGWYTDIFAKPEVDIVHRIMSVNEKWLRAALNLHKNQDIPEKGIKEVPYTYKSKRTCSSWTQDATTLGGFDFEPKDYLVVLSAKISDNSPNSFVTCVNKLYSIIGDEFENQQEAIGLIPLIKVFKIQWSTDDWWHDGDEDM